MLAQPGPMQDSFDLDFFSGDEIKDKIVADHEDSIATTPQTLALASSASASFR